MHRVRPYDVTHMLWNLLVLALVLLGTGVMLATLAAYLMARMLLCPPRMTDGRAAWRLRRLSPGDLHLRYSEHRFTVRDEATGQPLSLAAWWIPHPRAGGRTAVLLHGYADAKVGSIAWAPTLHALGFNVVALDLRAHGQSDGHYTTAGVRERYDVSQAIDQLKRDFPADTKQLILFGVSLGAAVAAATATLRDDLAAAILECPFPDYELAAQSHTAILGGPGRWLQRWSFRWGQRIANADFSTVKPVDLIPQIPCPLMVIRSEADVFIDADHAAMVEQATRSRPADRLTVYWNAANAQHVEALAANPAEYARRLHDFLYKALETGHPSSPEQRHLPPGHLRTPEPIDRQ